MNERMTTDLTRLERVLLGLIVTLMVMMAGAQAYRAGERHVRHEAQDTIERLQAEADAWREATEDADEALGAKTPAYKAGYDACMNKF